MRCQPHLGEHARRGVHRLGSIVTLNAMEGETAAEHCGTRDRRTKGFLSCGHTGRRGMVTESPALCSTRVSLSPVEEEL